MRVCTNTKAPFKVLRPLPAPSNFFLNSIDFVLHFDSSHYGRLSATVRNAVSAAQRDFLDIYGPLGLRAAHNDCLKILMYVFEKFPATTSLVTQ